VAMTVSEMKSVALATLAMGVVNIVLISLRVGGLIFFNTQFEFMLFDLPFILLILYLVFLWRKNSLA
jgi:hypothetical protein